MKANIYSNTKFIGTSELQVTDESMGVVSGKFVPTDEYEIIRKEFWKFNASKGGYYGLKNLRINAKLENGYFLFPHGSFLINDFEEFKNEEKTFEAIGIYRHVIEDYFFTTPPKQIISAPWQFISVDQKIVLENELHKEIGKNNSNKLTIFKRKKHRLSEYEFSAIATSAINDDVLFAINKKDGSQVEYTAIHLTWRGKIESDDNFPKTIFFKDFNHFSKFKMYPDKAN